MQLAHNQGMMRKNYFLDIFHLHLSVSIYLVKSLHLSLTLKTSILRSDQCVA